MFKSVERLYKEGKITETGVKNAVKKKWITNKELKEILKNK